MAKITDRELAFCEEYVANGYKQKAAYLKSFETENENSASVSAHRLLRKVEVIEKIKEIEGNYRIIGMALGVDRKFIMQKLKDMMSATNET